MTVAINGLAGQYRREKSSNKGVRHMNDQSNAPSAGVFTFAVWIGATAIVLLLLLGLVNYVLNPLTFRAGALHDVAKTLNRGQNFALDDPNIDFRSLRREHIHLMRSKPDVVLFAGSRFEVATANFLGKRYTTPSPTTTILKICLL